MRAAAGRGGCGVAVAARLRGGISFAIDFVRPSCYLRSDIVRA